MRVHAVVLLPFAFCILHLSARAESKGGEKDTHALPTPAQPLHIPEIEKPIRLPEGPAHDGWNAYVKNDYAAAEKAFRTVLEKEPKDLLALEGLRATLVQQGDYKAVQEINLRMVKAAPDNILCGIYANRAMDLLPYVESREAVAAAFTEASAAASSPVLSVLKDDIASLYLRAEQPAEARKTLEGLGYIDRWQFVAGPFGRKDRNDADVRARNLIERRFAPERELKSLEFTDESGEKAEVYKDVPARVRELNMDALFHGASGIFYAFTNLQSDVDQEVLLGFSASSPYRVYLRGQPVVLEPSDEHYHRISGELIRVRLAKGANPLMVKLSSTRSLIVRLFGSDYGLPKGIRVTSLDEKALAEHQISTVRGFRMSEKIAGATADYFLKMLSDDDRKAGRSIKHLVESGTLNLAEAAWADLALQRENDNSSRLALARTLLGSFKDSVGVLDLAASIMSAAGRASGDTETREVLESKLIRERALAILPASHQHLLQMYYYYNDHELKDEAFNTAKACAQAHPQSSTALGILAQAYENKQFLVEAETYYEKAAALDNAHIGRLAWFHEYNGNRARARELFKKEVQLALVDREVQFDSALRHGELDSAAALLAELERDYPERGSDLKNYRYKLLLEQGKLDDAYALQKQVYESQKEYDPNRRGTLQSLVDLALRMEKDDDARAMLTAFLKDNPGDFDFTRRLRDLQGDSNLRWWESYDIKVPQIDTSKFTAEKYPTANYATIVDFMVTKIQPDLSRESYIHIAHKVLNTEGINNLSELLVQAQRQNMLFVRTLNPDGSAFQPQNVHDFNLRQTASLYKVAPGSILEHAYIDRTATDKDDPTLSMAFNFNAIEAPRAVSRWTVMIPDELKDKLTIRKVRPEIVDEKILDGPAGYTVYQWSNKQIEGIKNEPFMPGEADQEVVPLVFIESKDRPFHANRWLMHRPPDFIPPEAADKARELAAKLADRPDAETLQFTAILDWVRANIKPGAESRTLDDVWFSRAGSAEQMMLLAREMSRAVGLNVSTAFLNGTYNLQRWHSKNAKRLWEPGELAGFGNAGQMLVLEPREGAERWAHFMGNSPKYYDYWDTNALQSGAYALVQDRGVARIKRVKGESTGVSNARQRAEIQLDEKGSGTITGLVQLFGQLSGQLREALSDPRYATRMKEQIARSNWRNLQVAKTATVNQERVDLPLGFSFSGVAQDLASSSGQSFFLFPFPGRARVMELRGSPERVSDLLLKSEVADLDQTLTYIAPEGHAWVEVPDNVFLVSEFGWYLVDFSVNGRTLTCTRSYLMPMQRVTPEKYPKLLEFLNQVGASQQQRIAYAPLAKDLPGRPQSVVSSGYSSFGDDK
jgi:hypothetical protein